MQEGLDVRWPYKNARYIHNYLWCHARDGYPNFMEHIVHIENQVSDLPREPSEEENLKQGPELLLAMGYQAITAYVPGEQLQREQTEHAKQVEKSRKKKLAEQGIGQVNVQSTIDIHPVLKRIGKENRSGRSLPEILKQLLAELEPADGEVQNDVLPASMQSVGYPAKSDLAINESESGEPQQEIGVVAAKLSTMKGWCRQIAIWLRIL